MNKLSSFKSIYKLINDQKLLYQFHHIIKRMYIKLNERKKIKDLVLYLAFIILALMCEVVGKCIK